MQKGRDTLMNAHSESKLRVRSVMINHHKPLMSQDCKSFHNIMQSL